MNNETRNRIAGIALCAISLIGLYFKVEYAGWVLFAGIILVL